MKYDSVQDAPTSNSLTTLPSTKINNEEIKTSHTQLLKSITTIFSIASISLLTALPQTSSAGLLYATDGYNENTHIQTLYSIDSSTGDVAAIGSTGYRVSDIAWDRTSNTLYGAVKTRSGRGFDGLVTLNTNTGAGTEVGRWINTDNAPFFSPNATQIDIDSNGNMYGSNKSGQLLDINSSTAGVSITSLTIQASNGADAYVPLGRDGFSFDSSDKLWRNIAQTNQYFSGIPPQITADPKASGSGFDFSGGVDFELITVDLNGFLLPFTSGRHGTFDLSTGLYWVLYANTIYKYDTSTGDIVESLDLIGAPALPGSFTTHFQGIRSLAFAPVPVPAAVWLFGSGLIGLISFSKRQKT